MVTKAVLAALVAFAVAAALTPLAARFAVRIGAVDELKERGLARKATPLLGGLAIFGGALVAGLLFLPDNERTEGILAAAALITIVGALDDVFDLHPAIKLTGQIAAAVVLVTSGVQVEAFTFPFVHRVELGGMGGPITVFAVVAADERRELLRRDRWAGGGRVRDLGARVRDHRLRPRPQHGGHPGRDHLRRRARLPDLQLQPGVGVHGRLRLEPARALTRCGDHRGHAQDERVDRARRPARRPRRAVPGHGLRGGQADQVPPPDLPRRLQPLPPPLPPDRLLAAAHGALPVRLDADHRRRSRWRCASSPTPSVRAT